MFGSALIIFRESLEAALIISIIAAATRGLPKRNFWIAIGMFVGLIGSLIVAGFTETIADLAEGTGQDLFNAAILGIAVLMLGWHNIWMSSHGREMAANAQSVGEAVASGEREMSALTLLIALAVLREGSETVLFMYGISAADNASTATLFIGGLIGLAAGMVAGWLLYRGLSRIPLRHFFTVTGALILFLAAGLAGQMARALIQGDYIHVMTSPVWDTSSVLPMNSVTGNLLHMFAGYEAQPSGMQLLFYGMTLLIILAGMQLVKRQSIRHTPTPVTP